jgi:hypothetical protein
MRISSLAFFPNYLLLIAALIIFPIVSVVLIISARDLAWFVAGGSGIATLFSLFFSLRYVAVEAYNRIRLKNAFINLEIDYKDVRSVSVIPISFPPLCALCVNVNGKERTYFFSLSLSIPKLSAESLLHGTATPADSP